MTKQKDRPGSRAVFTVSLPEALGESNAFLYFREQLSKVAPINRPVLLIGERGTGKELAASRLHFLSKRWQGPLVALNCSALSPSLIESELFGYEKGAFTGAEERREAGLSLRMEALFFWMKSETSQSKSRKRSCAWWSTGPLSGWEVRSVWMWM
jgi:psp operon transcriptional activator